MMQMQFTRLGQKARQPRSLPQGVTVREMAIAQLLGLAQSAGFGFDVIDGRLVAMSPTPDWGTWPTLRKCLDDIGEEALLAFFEHTSAEQRRELSASAN